MIYGCIIFTCRSYSVAYTVYFHFAFVFFFANSSLLIRDIYVYLDIYFLQCIATFA